MPAATSWNGVGSGTIRVPPDCHEVASGFRTPIVNVLAIVLAEDP